MIGRGVLRGHRAHDFLSKCAGLRGDAHQHRHFGIAHHIKKRDGSGRRKASNPATSVSFAHQRQLARANAFFALDQQAMTIEGIDATAGLRFAEPLLLHRGDEQVDDADARRTGAKHGDGLLGLSGMPVALTAASRVAVVTAAVPWMSSLKVQRRLR